MALITDPDSLNQGTEINIDTGTRTIELLTAGNLSNDGVTIQALYSFLKEEWKNDATLIPFPFPITAVTPEQVEWINDWEPTNDTTRKLIRTGGWREIDNNNVIKREYAGIITLGSFEDPNNDLAYYQVGNDPTDTNAAIDFAFAGPVNEAILTYNLNVGPDASTGFEFTTNTITRNDGGDWIADDYVIGSQVTVRNATNSNNDGTFEITDLTSTVITVSGSPFTADAADNTAEFATNYRNALQLFLRVRDADPNGKTYAQSALPDIGVTNIQNQVYRFPLSNGTDLKIEADDTTIANNEPYTEIEVRYFDQPFSLDIDTAGTPRDFGIVVDAGTFSGVDGSMTAAGATMSTAENAIPSGTFDGGALEVREGANSGSYTINIATGSEVRISGTFPSSTTNTSFTLQRSSPVAPTAEEIYEKVQYLLRQAADIDLTDQVVTGRTADSLLNFVGDTLNAGTAAPSNPNGGGSGVYISGFNSNDTNRLTFTDNTETERTFPFVAAGTINFNNNLVNDSGAEYWMFYEYTILTNIDDLSLDAIVSSVTASFSSSIAAFPTGTLSAGEFINIEGFTATPENNGIYKVDSIVDDGNIKAIKVDDETIATEGPVSGSIKENPIDSDSALIVDNNAGSDIAGPINAASVGFDFDYDGNVQGGRTAGTNANIVLRAIGLETAQFVQANGTITRNTGLSFTLVSALERNYQNPA